MYEALCKTVYQLASYKLKLNRVLFKRFCRSSSNYRHITGPSLTLTLVINISALRKCSKSLKRQHNDLCCLYIEQDLFCFCFCFVLFFFCKPHFADFFTIFQGHMTWQLVPRVTQSHTGLHESQFRAPHTNWPTCLHYFLLSENV